MYQRFFGLRAAPFGPSPDPRFLCMLPHVKEALACLHYGIMSRRGFIVMTGEVGTGKTTVLRTVLSSFVKDRVSSAFIFNPRLDFIEFLEFLLIDFGLTPLVRTKAAMLVQLNRWLIEQFQEGRVCVSVIDEAQHLSWELLEEIRLLTNLETSSQKLLQIVLSGQPELEQRLREPSVRQLRQRVSVWCRTHPLTAVATRTYIEERLRIAGACGPVFTSEATECVHSYSGGIPRVINLICEHALIAAYVEQINPVSAQVVQLVTHELDLDKEQSTSALANRGAVELPLAAPAVNGAGLTEGKEIANEPHL